MKLLSPKPPRVLYAEDDASSRLSISELLRDEGYDCVAASDGVEALNRLKQETFDCLISDIRMLGNNDLELIRALPEVQAGLPVILVTGFPTVETATASLRLPVTAYLVKPVNFDELSGAVREAVFRRRLHTQFEITRDTLTRWVSDIEQLANELQDSARVPAGDTADVYLMITYRNVLEALLGLRAVLEQIMFARPPQAGLPAPAGAAGVPMLLIDALRDTIDTLEKTKDAFRSRELGDLRRRLETLLDLAREK